MRNLPRLERGNPEAMLRVLTEKIVQGDLIVVELDRPRRFLDAPSIRPLAPPQPGRDQPTPTLPPGEDEQVASLDLLVTDTTGRPLSGIAVELRTPSDLGRQIALPASGRVSLRDIEASGVCRVAFPPIAEAFASASDAPAPDPAGVDETHEISPAANANTSLKLSTDSFHHVLVERPQLFRVETDSLRAAPGSALLLPDGASELRHPFEAVATALGHLAERRSHLLCIVGHAEANEPNPALLAEQRAAGVAAILRNERDAWVTIATEGGTYADVLAYLAYLADRRSWACDPGEITQAVTPESAAAVEAFQVEFNDRFEQTIIVDGVCGSQTLGAIFDVMRFELERWLDKHGLSAEAARLHPEAPIVSAAASFADAHASRTNDAASPAIVDLVMFDPAEVALETVADAAAIYEHGFAEFTTLVVHREEGDWEFGELTVVTDLPPEATDVEEKYRLFASDGSYDIELFLNSDAKAREGALELEFEGIPIGPTFTLSATTEAGATFVVFEGLAFSEFHPLAIETVGERLGERD